MCALQMTLGGFEPCLKLCPTLLDHTNILEPLSVFLTSNDHNSPLGFPNSL